MGNSGPYQIGNNKRLVILSVVIIIGAYCIDFTLCTFIRGCQMQVFQGSNATLKKGQKRDNFKNQLLQNGPIKF